MGTVFLFPTTPETDAPNMNYSVVVLGSVLLLSLAWYYCPVYGGVHWFTGPISNIQTTKDVDEKQGSRRSSESIQNEKIRDGSVAVDTMDSAST